MEGAAGAAEGAGPSRRRSLRRWARSSSRQTFVILPLGLLAAEAALQGGWPALDLRFAPLLLWGYGQYALCGRYRTRRGGGGPGMDRPPERIVESGPYALTRNPMYLGHLIFMAGVALVLQSWLAAVVALARLPRFHARALEDERRLEAAFGEAYRDYRRRVRRWIPYLF